MIERIDTKEVLFKSLCELCNTKPMEKITIDDIVKNCGYKRGTFYYYYKDKEDLIISAMYRNTRKIHDMYFEKENWKTIMVKNLEFCKEHVHLMKKLDQQNFRFTFELNNFMYDYVSGIAMKHFKTSTLSYEMTAKIRFYCAGSTAIYGEWISGGCKEDIDKVASVICDEIPKELLYVIKV